MKIKTKNEYSSVLKAIDELLTLSFLDKGQTKKLKFLLDALDEYQNSLIVDKTDAVSDLVKEHIMKGTLHLN